MKTYYVLWTYIGNYSNLMTVPADNAEEAIKVSCVGFSADFVKRASVFVFDAPPALIQYRGESFPRMGDTANKYPYNTDRAHVDAYRRKVL